MAIITIIPTIPITTTTTIIILFPFQQLHKVAVHFRIQILAVTVSILMEAAHHAQITIVLNKIFYNLHNLYHLHTS